MRRIISKLSKYIYSKSCFSPENYRFLCFPSYNLQYPQSIHQRKDVREIYGDRWPKVEKEMVSRLFFLTLTVLRAFIFLLPVLLPISCSPPVRSSGYTSRKSIYRNTTVSHSAINPTKRDVLNERQRRRRRKQAFMGTSAIYRELGHKLS